jgi:hypothetical protein
VPKQSCRGDSALLVLGRDFRELKLAMERANEDARAHDLPSTTPADRRRLRNRIDWIDQELFALANASLSLPATSVQEVKVKAELLLEYADPEATDIVGRLINDLCRSIRTLTAA